MKPAQIFLLTVVIMATSNSCNNDRVSSDWPDQPITIDGDLADWQRGFMPLQDNKLGGAVANDNEFLYLALTIRDRGLARMAINRGMILWLEGTARPKHRFGIRFPLGMMESPDAMKDMRQRDREPVFDERWLDYVEILGKDRIDTRRFPVSDLPGIEVAVGGDPYNMTYEVRIPLAIDTDFPYAIAVNPGETVRLELTIPQPQFAGHRQPGGISALPSAGGGMGGRGGSRQDVGGRGGMGRPGNVAPLQVKLKVILAETPG
ncbi:MAG: hypothetical protein KAU50_05750 [Candidatus Marinimicrobia bacterium]|nr:hypothetical protein [Candidatus Neomarinimicrobiota bacterium]